jgi:hypothetical protein
MMAYLSSSTFCFAAFLLLFLFCCIFATAPKVQLPYNGYFVLFSTFSQGGICPQELPKEGIPIVKGHNEGHKNI